MICKKREKLCSFLKCQGKYHNVHVNIILDFLLTY